MDIGEYAYTSDTPRRYIRYFETYLDGLPNENLRVYRYEDVVFRKYEWLKDMLAYLDVDVPDERIRQVADANDIRPTEERSDQHIRQVTPGNYRKHLSEEAIAHLNEQFRPILERFGYLPFQENDSLHWPCGLLGPE